ncbi:8-oxo-dGTP diphosphatase [Dubosiella muris]|uniref:8-oxo-dGTP diphosphatase n=1 Tax=Dubosiella muris TaxID=3038133 RepID=A0AC61R666_9FIRM|nr:8-oxo-dGTP diphosphatase [Dubosiella muris]TGY65328.1 8-oxo-dGTP diphosphatase [Dubosiella muris]
MVNTTLGYIEHDGKYLMIHRIKKKNDINKDKWIGIGGKMEPGETVLDCMKRECKEETGLDWHDPTLRAIITFNFQKDETDSLFSELMFLYTGKDFSGELIECDEGELVWIEKDKIKNLPLWTGDLIFLDLMQQDIPLFYLRLDYVGDRLVLAELDGKKLEI